MPKRKDKTPLVPTVYVQLLARSATTGKPRYVKGSTITVLRMTPRHVYGVINEALRQEACRIRDEEHKRERNRQDTGDDRDVSDEG